MDKDVPLFNHQHITTDSQSVEDVITIQEPAVNDDTLEFTETKNPNNVEDVELEDNMVPNIPVVAPISTRHSEVSSNPPVWKYALELIFEAGLAGAQPVFTPLECNIKLTSVTYNTSSDDPIFLDISRYQRMIGKLLYLTNTRPDIAFAVQNLSQFMQQPKHSHWNAALRVIKYIKGSPGLGLLMSSRKDTKLTGFRDADWAACLSTRRSVTGYLLKFGDSLISWKSKKQNTVSRSSAEAEYRSLAILTAKVVW
uniref:Reverse transcriptase Ty1/copia-type domain-containing protein n=1 Tax=Solanum lycopersicum TaxID=4081 RepID=A0A3Q7FM67_SOLLC